MCWIILIGEPTGAPISVSGSFPSKEQALEWAKDNLPSTMRVLPVDTSTSEFSRPVPDTGGHIFTIPFPDEPDAKTGLLKTDLFH